MSLGSNTGVTKYPSEPFPKTATSVAFITKAQACHAALDNILEQERVLRISNPSTRVTSVRLGVYKSADKRTVVGTATVSLRLTSDKTFLQD